MGCELILNENVLNKVSGGDKVVKSSAERFCNVRNFYLNLLPGVHKKHYKVTFTYKDWEEGIDDSHHKRVIIEDLEETEACWKSLSKSERFYALSPFLTVAATGTALAVCQLGRWLNSKYDFSKFLV